MVISVPRKITPEVQSQGLPNVSQRIDTPEGMFGDGGRGLAQAADALDKLGASLDKRVRDDREEQNAARALELETMARREAMDALYNPEAGLLTRKGGLALGVQSDMQKRMEAIREKYGNIKGDNQVVREMVGKKLAALEESTLDVTGRHQFGEFQSYKTEQLSARQALNMEDVALNFNDEKNFTAKWEENLKALKAQSTQEGWSVDQYSLKRTELYSKMRSAQIVAMLGQDTPDAILKAKEVYDEAQGRGMLSFEDSTKMDSLFDAAVPKAAAKKAYEAISSKAAMIDQDQIINYVIDSVEGGEKIAQEPKGGVAKYGISSDVPGIIRSGFNADQVKGLDRKTAYEWYKKEKWDAFNIDQLPDNMKYVAYDTAVNHTFEFAQKAIKEANGDPKALIEARYKEYIRLAKAEPETYASSLPGWKNRLSNLSKQLTTSTDTKSVEEAAGQLDQQYPGAGEELLALHKSTTQKIEQSKKLQKQDFLDSVMPRLYETNGDWSQLSSEEKAKAIELDVWDSITKFNGVTDPAVGTAIAQMSPDDVLSQDFSQPQWRARMSQSDYESILKKQTDLRDKPAARGEFRTTQSILAEGWRSIGNSTSSTEYYKFQSVAEDAFAAEIEARGGKPLSSDDKRKIVSKLILNTSVGAKYWDFEDQKRVYQLPPDASYQISGIDPAIADSALSVLIQSNQEPTQENIEKLIKKPSEFIKIDGYNDQDISGAVSSLMRAGAPVNSSTVKVFLERRKNGG